MMQAKIRSSCASSTPAVRSAVGLWVYLIVGVFFGLVLVKSEAASWYRIQEMFRFESFHMFGIMGSAVVTGLISTWLLRRLKKKALSGEPIHIKPKAMTWRRYVFGGLLFGLRACAPVRFLPLSARVFFRCSSCCFLRCSGPGSTAWCRLNCPIDQTCTRFRSAITATSLQ